MPFKKAYIKHFILGLSLFFVSQIAHSQCTARFTAEVSCDTLQVVDSSSWNGVTIERRWSFGDGSQGIGPDYKKLYSRAGVYNVTLHLTVFDGNRRVICVDSTTQVVTIQRTCCKADFSPYSVGLYAAFFDQSFTSNGHSVLFDYGDGTKGSEQRHTYQRPGQYNVCLTIFDSIANCSDSICKSVVVDTPLCEARFSHWVDSNNKTLYLTFDGQYPEFGTYFFGDGDNVSLEPKIQHTYDSAGTYNVTLRVFKQLDSLRYFCDSTITVTIPEIPKSCRSGFKYTTDKFTVHFEALDSGGTSYHWYLGDGDSARGRTATHTYPKDSFNRTTYSFCLEVRDSTINCVSRSCGQVTIPDSCILDSRFELTYDSVTGRLVCTPFTQAQPMQHIWVIEELQDTILESTLTYSLYGPETFTITHFVEWDDSTIQTGCVNKTTKTLVIPTAPACYANFQVAVDTNQKFKLYIVNLSKGDNLKYLWDMGDSTFYSIRNPKHRYKTFGKYNVTLQVSNARCTNVVTHSLGMDESGKLLKQEGFEVEVIERKVIGIPDPPELHMAKVYPNPFTNEINVTIEGQSDHFEKHLQLFDLKGVHMSVSWEKEGSKWKASTAHLPQGVYILRIGISEQVQQRRLIKF